jgi:hypothetical protein
LCSFWRDSFEVRRDLHAEAAAPPLHPLRELVAARHVQAEDAIRRFGNAPYFGRVVGDLNQPIVGGVDRGYDG